MEEKLLSAPLPYVTTGYLLSLFSSYKYPRDKIKNLVHKGELLNIKKGLYLLWGPHQKIYSKEVLSGMIYGPSVISFEYALSYYGLIPEKVYTVTCLCFKRDKSFDTQIGQFTYKYIAREIYPEGVKYFWTDQGNYFMASPEKALCDMAYFQKLASDREGIEYILEDLRIDKSALERLDISLLINLRNTYRRQSVVHLVNALMILQNDS